MSTETSAATPNAHGRLTYDLFREAIDHLRERASVEHVYGEPIVTEGKTIVPVARVVFGFGGGLGSGPEEDPDSGEGGGGGGGAAAKPVGVLEVTDAGTRFIEFGNRRRSVVAAVVGLALGWLLGRR